MNRTGAALVGLVLLLSVGALVASGAFLPFTTGEGYDPTPAPNLSDTASTPTDDGRYDHATVTVRESDGTELGTVRVAVADTPQKRYTGLSETESLPEDRGMLFTYDSEGSHTYVMRGMSFGIDIVYIGSNGTVTQIHHAPEPPEDADGESYRYPGTGQYVLEVNYGWTTRHNVSEGDQVEITGL